MIDPIYIKIEPANRLIHYSVRVYYVQEQDENKNPLGRVSGFIPVYNIYFSADTMDAAKKRSKTLTKLFFKRYVTPDFKTLERVIGKMGFVKERVGAISKNFKRSKTTGNWKSDDPWIPESFISGKSETVEQTAQVALAN